MPDHRVNTCLDRDLAYQEDYWEPIWRGVGPSRKGMTVGVLLEYLSLLDERRERRRAAIREAVFRWTGVKVE